MTSGSFQTQLRFLYVELYLKVGQIITMKLKWFLYFQAGSMLNEFFPTPVGATNSAVCGSFINILVI